MVGAPRINYMPYPFEIMQTPNQITILYEYVHTSRHLPDGGPPRAGSARTRVSALKLLTEDRWAEADRDRESYDRLSLLRQGFGAQAGRAVEAEAAAASIRRTAGERRSYRPAAASRRA